MGVRSVGCGCVGVRSVGCGLVNVRGVINKGSSCIWRQMY